MQENNNLNELEDYIKRYVFVVRASSGRILGEGILNKEECEQEGILLAEPLDPNNIKYLVFGTIDCYGIRLTPFLVVKLNEDKLDCRMKLHLRLAGDLFELVVPEAELKRFYNTLRLAIYYINKINILNKNRALHNRLRYFSQLKGHTLSHIINKLEFQRPDFRKNHYKTSESENTFL